jgi:hypothetical protein
LLRVGISRKMRGWDNIRVRDCSIVMILTITLQRPSSLRLAMVAFRAGDGHGWEREKDLPSSASGL